MSLSKRVKQLGRDAGFDLVRIASAEPLVTEGKRFAAWVDDGRQAGMAWISSEWAARASTPTVTLPGAHSVICVGMRYWTVSRAPTGPDRGRIARYAWGTDYHEVLGDRLAKLTGSLRKELGAEHRWYVDTGPLMDKALAARAGVGWYGKNTNILTTEFGSWVLLGEIVTTLPLEPDESLAASCGACRACVAACPTGAIDPEYSIDSRKCISYLTIEHRGPIPSEYRAAIGAWVFGCDICQDVCPPSMRPVIDTPEARRGWAREVRSYMRREEPDSWGGSAGDRHAAGAMQDDEGRQSVDLIWLLNLDHGEYLQAFRGTSIRRAKVWMLRRNAAIALGNVGTQSAVLPLLASLRHDEHPVVRSHAAWAIGRLVERGVCDVPYEELRVAYDTDEDEDVRREALAVL